MSEFWRGNRYGHPDNDLVGGRMLILGESPYTKKPDEIGKPLPGLTPWLIRTFAVTGRRKFYNRLLEICIGTDQSNLTRATADLFWQSVAFYNYVPVMVDGRPASEGGNNRRPEPWMFAAGAGPLRQVLDELEPQSVVVCGLELWEWVAPSLDGFEGPPRDVIFYDDGRRVFARIHHPSYRNFDAEYWHPRMHELMERAARPRNHGEKTMWDR